MSNEMDVLHHIYWFDGEELPSEQSKDACKEIANLFSEFGKHMMNNEDENKTDFNSNHFEKLSEFLTGVKSEDEIRWFPEYGCVLLINNDENLQRHDSLYFTLLGLDSFERVVHSNGEKFEFTARAKSYMTDMIGPISRSKRDSFFVKFRDIFDSASRIKGAERSSRGNRQGHQKTPAFIKALLLQALGCNCSAKDCKCGQSVLPEGGCTDVGLHTGGRARCTEYELVKSVCEWKLKMMYLNDCQTSSWCHEPSFDLVMMYFDTYILETTIRSAEKEFCFSCEGVPQRCAKLWKIQEALCCRSAFLADHGYTVDSHLLKVKSLKERIYKLFGKVQDMHKMQNNISFRLPSFECFQSPRIVPAELDRTETDRKETSENTLDARAIEYVPSFDFRNYSISSAHKWALHTKTWHETIISLQAFMSEMERIFWKLEKYLDKPLEDKEDIVRLSEILDIYRDYVEKLLKMSKFAKTRTVQFRSIELLATWLVYCVIFNGVRGHYPTVMLREFGVALRYQDLRHLVLQNEKHGKVLLKIVSFLKRNYRKDAEIFSIRKDQNWSSATFKMGTIYANKFLKLIYKKEKDLADSRVGRHWEEVQKKQKLSKQLRSELENLQKNLENENYEWNTALTECHKARNEWKNSHCSCSTWYYDKFCSICEDPYNTMKNAERISDAKKAKRERTKSEMSSKQNEIDKVESPPDPVIQPLPQDEYRSMAVLFFLHMPEEFAILANISFISQQLLVPKPRQLKYYKGGSFSEADVLEQMKVNKNYIPWFDHYNKYQTGEKNANATSLVEISMKKEVKRKRSIGSSSVLDYSTEMDGVFYPDDNDIRLAWFGGKLSSDKMDARIEFNPFKISSEYSAAYFTQDLPKCVKELQWCMYPTNENDIVDRGNKPYASQDLKPTWLDREGFLHFARIRENPNMMLHKLCLALKAESLPLQHECVQVLVAQSTFQVGNISSSVDDNCTIFEWKRDFENIRKVCIAEITSVIEKYAESPSLYAAFPFLAEIFSFLLNFSYGEERAEDEEGSEEDDDQFFSENEDTSCVLSSSAISWASACDDDISEADPEHISSIRSRQVIYFRTAVLSLAQKRHLTDMDSESILNCIVRARNAFVEEKDDVEIRNKLYFLCLNTLCENEQYSRNISKHKSMLTNALRMVIASAPAKLNWNMVTNSSEQFKSNYVFVAYSHGHQYVINIVTGTVLVDGMPPTILPQHITEDKRYKRIFGNNIFEIVNRDEWMETRQPVHGKLYRFRSTSDDLLLIEESSDMKKVTRADIWEDPLELLHVSDIEHWGKDLPKKLKVSYSHWFSRKGNIAYFRGIDFRERDIYFTHNMQYCENNPRGIINKVRTQKDRLVMHQSTILNIFERVESKEVIHSYLCTDEVSGEKCFRVELFRLGLTFSLVKGEGVFKCHEVVGYQLASIQHLEVIPSGFSNYLLLENSEDKSLQRIIVPFGRIDRISEKGQVVINTLSRDLKVAAEDVDKEIHVFQYDVHPRLHTIMSSSICGRLFLACIFAASMYELPYKALAMTEEEQAMTLLRECHLNRPMDSTEIQVLQNFTTLCKGKSASLLLLAHDLNISAQEFKFLHPSSYNTDISLELQRHDVCNSISVYLNNAKGTSKRLQLSSSESKRILGSPHSPIFVKKSCILNSASIAKTPPLSEKIVLNVESKIQDIRKSATLRNFKKRPFPIITEAKTELEEIIYEDLSKSWDIYSKRKEYRPYDIGKSLAKLTSLAQEVFSDVKKIETYIIDVLVSDCKSVSNGYRRLMNNIPTITKADMMKIACDRDLALVFNPILSGNDVKKIHKMILLWLELCVLQDKCEWLIKCASDKSRYHDFFVEISSIRTWKTYKHPYWLVFEAEQGIRIRPEQYEIANYLIHNNGSIVQLNCGQGKTRVILPMLVLYFAHQGKFDRIPRLHILNTLLGEFCEYFESALSASVMNIKLYTMPFRRDVEINESTISSMQDLVNRCMSDRGCLIVAPEHRLSMEMKVKELYLEKSFDLHKRLELIVNTRWQDIFDEIDEILHYRYQLIYSIGNIEPLPQMNCRWTAAEILLQILIEKGQLINGIELIPRKGKEEACPIYILNNVNHDEFREKMTEMLLKHPHVAVQWMQKHSRLEEISKVISDPTADPQLLQKKILQGHFDQVLAFRGLLAHDLLLHCLKKRYRVDFGFREGSKKQLSVPFRGADTPSERSEFSHPDTAVVLSLLSYYNRGLSNENLKIAFQALLKKGREFQRKTYSKWLSRSKTRLDANVLKTIDRVEKIDLTNGAQFNTLFEYFHINPETINFWVNSFVFPRDLDQYPHRLVGSPWNLADNKDGCSIGFSGTNDNHLVMPLQMKQHLPWNTTDPIWCDLLATNGKMIDVIVQKTKSVHVLADGIPSEKLLQFISSDEVDKVDALIDCGALLVGYSCEEVAKYILQHLIEKSRILKGVTFYDDKREDWMILEKSGRCLTRVQSSLEEIETFVVFDEPRCRGVDMKLRSDAVAVMTLGQNLTKDKFMQAAGRMRKLHSNQSLIIVGEKQICQEIGKNSCLNTLSIIEWIIRNTVESVVKGLQIWSDQGIFFHTATEAKHSILDEKSDLSSFYGRPIKIDDLSKSASISKSFHFKRTSKTNSNRMETRATFSNISTIIKRCGLGTGYKIRTSATDEECEREMQREVEEEEEEEIEVAKQIPCQQHDWDYGTIFSCNSACQLSINPISFYDMLLHNMSNKRNIRKVQWPNNLYCTPNFISTIKVENGYSIDEYLRLPDCFVRFPDTSVVLLSDREGANIYELFLHERDKQNISNYFFGHFAYESDPKTEGSLRCDLNEEENMFLSSSIACSIKLFNGDTRYSSSQRESVKRLLSFNESTNDFAQSFVNARDKGKDFEMSDLERICEEIVLELEQ
ncbi:hypothetical protein CTEN210_14846 [Chaetoceros tenuissimus]|uniref:ubiquitinyl hydrolase 1 n=1 Tax=Chaetoceros tenuissimus TaxID=426638 RepID=A0AAD3HCB5_9STRA|nr:hypothetical protein CTEN210_14846 [Chaetoceros tenuissimus]